MGRCPRINAWCGAVCCIVAWRGVWCGVVFCRVVVQCCGVVGFGVVYDLWWCGVVWCMVGGCVCLFVSFLYCVLCCVGINTILQLYQGLKKC